jgi:hypothetical protein
MSGFRQCLYCSSPANSIEHVLPAAFGEFAAAPVLENRVCDICNNRRLGVLDEQLARCARRVSSADGMALKDVHTTIR